MTYFLLIIGAMFVNNFVLCQFLGCCPFLGVSKKTDTALGMGLAVIFVMGIASVFTWLVQKLLVAAGIDYLQTIAFILVIAALVQLVEWCSKSLCRRCTARWAYICPSSQPTAPCSAWRYSTFSPTALRARKACFSPS